MVGDFAMAKCDPPPALVEGDFIGSDEAGTLWGLFCERVRRSPHAIAYREYDPDAGKWCEYTWRSITARVDPLRSALARDGFRPGDHVAVLLPNGIDWVSFDLAAHGSGLVVVGLYPHDTPASIAAILGHSDACLVVLDLDGRWRSLAAFRSEFPLLRRVWIRAGDSNSALPATGPTVRELADVLANECGPPLPHPAAPGDTATLIYTSGTWRRPPSALTGGFCVSGGLLLQKT
jgi:long-chain acyl-CoA synthetase